MPAARLPCWLRLGPSPAAQLPSHGPTPSSGPQVCLQAFLARGHIGLLLAGAPGISLCGHSLAGPKDAIAQGCEDVLTCWPWISVLL